MADFEAVNDNDNYDSNIETELDANIGDVEFIDDENDFNESVETHYAFTNVNRHPEDAMQDSFINFDYSQEANNYCPDDYDSSDDVIDEFKDSSKKVNHFRSTFLIPHSLENKDRFILLFFLQYIISTILSLYWNIRVRKNPYSGIFYAVVVLMNCKRT